MSASHGQELKVGLSAEPSAMDPHFHNLAPNNSLLRHIFDRLTHQDENQAVIAGSRCPGATLDETTWEFKLRPGVKFTDGSDFTANDVIYIFLPRAEGRELAVLDARSIRAASPA